MLHVYVAKQSYKQNKVTRKHFAPYPTVQQSGPTGLLLLLLLWRTYIIQNLYCRFMGCNFKDNIAAIFATVEVKTMF